MYIKIRVQWTYNDINQNRNIIKIRMKEKQNT